MLSVVILGSVNTPPGVALEACDRDIKTLKVYLADSTQAAWSIQASRITTQMLQVYDGRNGNNKFSIKQEQNGVNTDRNPSLCLERELSIADLFESKVSLPLTCFVRNQYNRTFLIHLFKARTSR